MQCLKIEKKALRVSILRRHGDRQYHRGLGWRGKGWHSLRLEFCHIQD